MINYVNKKNKWWLFGLIIMTFGIYTPYLLQNNNFFSDDIWMVVNNPYIKNLDSKALIDIFTSDYYSQYSPINTLLYSLIYHLFGLDAFYFHLVCLFLHIVNAFLIFLLSYKLLIIKNVKSNTVTQPYVPPFFICFISALLFAINPLQIESVAWISASKIVLYTFFFLVGLICYMNFLQKKQVKYYILSLSFFLLSIGSKEQGVVFPIVLLLIIYYIFDTYYIRNFILLIPFFIISLLFGIYSLNVQNIGFASKFQSDYYPLGQRFFLACYSITQYIEKIVFPLKISSSYPFPMQPGEPIPRIYYFYPISIIALFYYLYLLFIKKHKTAIFGFAFFVVNIFLCLHIIPLGRDTVIANRYIYVPSFGIFFIMTFYIYDAIKNFSKKNFIILILTRLIFFIYIIFLYITSLIYIKEWISYK